MKIKLLILEFDDVFKCSRLVVDSPYEIVPNEGLKRRINNKM